MNWYVKSNLNYLPFRNGELSFSIGDKSEDYNGQTGLTIISNSISSLFFGSNPVRFYRNKFIVLNNSIDLINGFRINTGIELQKRDTMENNTKYNFKNRTPHPNKLPSPLPSMPRNSLVKTDIGISYTPNLQYEIDHSTGRKIDQKS